MQYFAPELFAFLRELADNNNKAWFDANKRRYETYAKQPMLRFLADVEPELKPISSEFQVDLRSNGGSMFRIYRDTRFSKDKTPYKTNIGAHIMVGAIGGEAPAPGLYFHLQPARCMVGGGIWMAEPAVLTRIRDRIVAEPAVWQAIRTDLALDDWESLKRVPAGYDPAHPHAEDLKRKSFTASLPLSEAQICSEECLQAVVAGARTMSPLLAFLAAATGVPY